MIQDAGLARVHGANHVFRVLGEDAEGFYTKTLGHLAMISKYSIVLSVRKYNRGGWVDKPFTNRPKDVDTCEIETKTGPFYFWRALGAGSWRAWREPTAGELSKLSDMILDDNANLFPDFFATLTPEG